MPGQGSISGGDPIPALGRRQAVFLGRALALAGALLAVLAGFARAVG